MPRMESGQALTSWTIRLALVAYVAALGLGFPASFPEEPNSRRLRWSRIFWSAGGLFMFVHVVSAFHFYHGWSHRRAWDDTAKQTQELLGWAFGGGIFFSYLFVLAWLLDSLWWWISPLSFAHRPPWLHWTLHAYLAFIVFNGAIVFEAGATRWIGLCVTPVLVWISYRRYRNRASEVPSI